MLSNIKNGAEFPETLINFSKGGGIEMMRRSIYEYWAIWDARGEDAAIIRQSASVCHGVHRLKYGREEDGT